METYVWNEEYKYAIVGYQTVDIDLYIYCRQFET